MWVHGRDCVFRIEKIIVWTIRTRKGTMSHLSPCLVDLVEYTLEREVGISTVVPDLFIFEPGTHSFGPARKVNIGYTRDS